MVAQNRNKIVFALSAIFLVIVVFVYDSSVTRASLYEVTKDDDKQMQVIQDKFVQQAEFNQRIEQKVDRLETLVLGLYTVVEYNRNILEKVKPTEKEVNTKDKKTK